MTPLGQSQATALGQSDFMRTTQFWRCYTSDLGRAMDSTRILLLQLLLHPEWTNVVVDKRLRELAKGVMEGLPKDTHYNDAWKQFMDRHGEDINTPPHLESEPVAALRLQRWLVDVVRDAVLDTTRTPKNILAMSHSGSIRTLVNALVPEPLPDTAKEPLFIPNMSVTIIEMIIHNAACKVWCQGKAKNILPNEKELWDVKLIKLGWCPHLEEFDNGQGDSI